MQREHTDLVAPLIDRHCRAQISNGDPLATPVRFPEWACDVASDHKAREAGEYQGRERPKHYGGLRIARIRLRSISALLQQSVLFPNSFPGAVCGLRPWAFVPDRPR